MTKLLMFPLNALVLLAAVVPTAFGKRNQIRLLVVLLAVVGMACKNSSGPETPKGLDLRGHWIGIDSAVSRSSDSVFNGFGYNVDRFRNSEIIGVDMVLASTSTEETYAESGTTSY